MNQLNTLENTSLLDIYLSTGNVVEPHIHQNAAELVYCISGSAVVSLLNPFTNQILNLPIKPGQVANIPKAWWHYEIATADGTHLLAIFDAPTPEVIFGSDILRLTPANIMAHTYCLDEQQWKQAVSPIQSTTVIGPPANCNQNRGTIPLQLILLIHNKIYITKIHIIFLFTGDINLYYERTIIYLLGKYVGDFYCIPIPIYYRNN